MAEQLTTPAVDGNAAVGAPAAVVPADAFSSRETVELSTSIGELDPEIAGLIDADASVDENGASPEIIADLSDRVTRLANDHPLYPTLTEIGAR